MLYTVSPKEAYLVKQEYVPEMSAGDMTKVEHDIADRIDSYIEEGKEYLGKEKLHKHDNVQRAHEASKNGGSPLRASPSKGSPSR